ncbi:MAG: hypothetical protein ACQEQC_06105 [Elusimicrobiota bacterium]
MNTNFKYFVIFILLFVMAGTGCDNKESQLSEEEYIELIANWNVLHRLTWDLHSELIKEDKPKLARRIKAEGAKDAMAIRESLGITPEELNKFEEENPNFLEDSENKQKIYKRIEEIIEEKE